MASLRNQTDYFASGLLRQWKDQLLGVPGCDSECKTLFNRREVVGIVQALRHWQLRCHFNGQYKRGDGEGRQAHFERRTQWDPQEARLPEEQCHHLRLIQDHAAGRGDLSVKYGSQWVARNGLCFSHFQEIWLRMSDRLIITNHRRNSLLQLVSVFLPSKLL